LNSDDPTVRALAIERATDYATRDNVDKSRLMTVTGDNVLVSFPQETNKMRVQVDVQRTVPLFFARVLGWPNKTIPATATAEAFGVCKKVRCVVPWGIPAPYTDVDHDNTFSEGDELHWNVGTDNGAPTADWCNNQFTSYTVWDNTTHQISGPKSGRDDYLCQGSLQVLKIGVPGNLEYPGNFLALNLQPLIGPEGCPGIDPSPGANFYYWMIEHSCDCDLKLGIDDKIPIDTKPGEMVKRTITAVAPTNYYTDPYYPVTDPVDPYLPKAWLNDQAVEYSLMNADPGSYWKPSDNPAIHSGEPVLKENSGRVVRIPIYDPTSFAGRTEITPLAYVGFWIQDVVYKTETIDGKTKDLGTVVGRFVTVEGVGTYENADCGSTVLNIRLVK
jgi:hypothetical protein